MAIDESFTPATPVISVFEHSRALALSFADQLKAEIKMKKVELLLALLSL